MVKEKEASRTPKEARGNEKEAVTSEAKAPPPPGPGKKQIPTKGQPTTRRNMTEQDNAGSELSRN